MRGVTAVLTIAAPDTANALPRWNLLIQNEIALIDANRSVPFRAPGVRFRTPDELPAWPLSCSFRLVRMSLGVALLLAAVVVAATLVTGAALRSDRDGWSGAESARNDALRRAKVLHPAADRQPIDLSLNPPDLATFGSEDLVECQYVPSAATGMTPKFTCLLRTGESVKVKYGRSPELAAEFGATRLLSALGFGADRMFLVPRVRCFGCPLDPFRLQQATDLVRGQRLLEKALDYSRWTEFEWAAIEREPDAPEITAGGAPGWAWWELDRVDPSSGGASRAEIDAFRLMALFLAHWDNKSENQRLVCLSGEPDGQRCASPFAMIDDAGATFGPAKVDLEGWRAAPIWTDRATCRTSMRTLPHRGATYSDARISEAGRRLLASRLSRVTDADVRDLVVAARFAAFDGSEAESREVAGWVETFMDKVREITDRPPCPK
jgi:hypothetical protein